MIANRQAKLAGKKKRVELRALSFKCFASHCRDCGDSGFCFHNLKQLRDCRPSTCPVWKRLKRQKEV